jgi:hypothetical protein
MCVESNFDFPNEFGKTSLSPAVLSSGVALPAGVAVFRGNVIPWPNPHPSGIMLINFNQARAFIEKMRQHPPNSVPVNLKKHEQSDSERATVLQGQCLAQASAF